MAKLYGLTPPTAKKVQELVRGLGDSNFSKGGMNPGFINHRVCLVKAVSRYLDGTDPTLFWNANIILVDEVQGQESVGDVWLYDYDDRIKAGSLYQAIEMASDIEDDVPVFITTNSFHPDVVPGVSVNVVSDVVCSSGLVVTKKALTGVVTIYGVDYPIKFTIT